MTTKLYLVTRRDLPNGPQAVQSAHALREFVALYPDEDLNWYKSSNILALVCTENESTLHALLEKARKRGIPAAPFYEPDLNNALTAVAIGPEGRKLCARLRLTLD